MPKKKIKEEDLFESIFSKMSEIEGFVNNTRLYARVEDRIKINREVEIKLYTEGEDILDSGTATLFDLSSKGLLLRNIKLKKYYLPMKKTRVSVCLKTVNCDLCLIAHPIRLAEEKGVIVIAATFLKPIENIARVLEDILS